jgi:CheY-like chemotaxis protein
MEHAAAGVPFDAVITIGPVRASSARAWLREAEHTLRTLRDNSCGTPPEVVDEFAELVSEWRAHAGGLTFHWTTTTSFERLQTLASQWAAIAVAARDDANAALRVPDPDAQEFYDALVTGVVDALRDNGATFASVVPAFDDAAPATQAPPVRVLIVDDTDDIRLLVRLGLAADSRFEVVGEAIDGVEAIDKARASRPDAVLLDVAMPRMDGIEALPHLRELVPDARIVVFSANSRYQPAAMAAGADAFIEKGAPRATIAAALLSA